MGSLTVYLYRVGRNLNRAYRTCEAFGVQDLKLVDCDAKLAGHLYGAAGRVRVAEAAFLEDAGTLALETWAGPPLSAIDWHAVSSVLIGGETAGLPRGMFRRAQFTGRIPTVGHVSGLTVEAALAIALYAWRQSC